MDECLSKMTYVIDSREQPTEKLKTRMAFLTPFVRETVNAGDYTAKTMLPSGEWFYVPAAVERKMNLGEIAGNFCGTRERFRAEFNRASEHGIRLYILIEDSSWEAAYNGHYRSKMSPQSMIASLLTWSARYGSPILMCRKPETAGMLIRDILHYEMREALQKKIE